MVPGQRIDDETNPMNTGIVGSSMLTIMSGERVSVDQSLTTTAWIMENDVTAIHGFLRIINCIFYDLLDTKHTMIIHCSILSVST